MPLSLSGEIPSLPCCSSRHSRYTGYLSSPLASTPPRMHTRRAVTVPSCAAVMGTVGHLGWWGEPMLHRRGLE
jgi:hypothetical protein